MFLTRIGENSKIVINGDPSQIDLPNKSLLDYKDQKLLGHLKEIAVVDFDHKDVVRHPLVSKIVKAYTDKAQTDDKGQCNIWSFKVEEDHKKTK